MRQIRINGSVEHLPSSTQVIQFAGESSSATPLRWEIT
jgi:hypothetical protein